MELEHLNVRWQGANVVQNQLMFVRCKIVVPSGKEFIINAQSLEMIKPCKESGGLVFGGSRQAGRLGPRKLL
jgi:hypothetical protein